MEKTPLVKCTFCGTVGRAKIQWRGNKSVARFLWLTLLFPGPLYNYWQWQGRKQVCSYCDSVFITPVDSAETLDRFDQLKAMENSEPFLAAPVEPKAEKKPHDPTKNDQF